MRCLEPFQKGAHLDIVTRMPVESISLPQPEDALQNKGFSLLIPLYSYSESALIRRSACLYMGNNAFNNP
jgi:hypothetical protein